MSLSVAFFLRHLRNECKDPGDGIAGSCWLYLTKFSLYLLKFPSPFFSKLAYEIFYLHL